MKKILLYSHDTFGLGNIRRMVAIAEYLVSINEQVSVLILSGSPMLHAFRITTGIDYIKLPCLKRNEQGEYLVKSLHLDWTDTIRLRANIILNTVIDFDPDVFLIDKKPFGVGNELAPAIEAMRRRSALPKMYLLLRDILDAPENTIPVWEKNNYHGAINELYEQVLVVGSKRIFDLAHEYQYPQSSRAKLRYCGYIRRQPSAQSTAALRAALGIQRDEKMVLVTVGGGEDGQALVRTFLHAIGSQRQRHPGFKTVVLLGPEMSKATTQRLQDDAPPSVQFNCFSDDIMAYMQAAELVVSMAGYNTVCELMSLGKRAILVPRERPVLEQLIRAQRFQAAGCFTTLPMSSLTPQILLTTIQQQLEIQVLGKHFDELDGLPTLASILLAKNDAGTASRAMGEMQLGTVQ